MPASRHTSASGSGPACLAGADYRCPTPFDFVPPHCPNRSCKFYRPRPGWRWRRDGFYDYAAYSIRFQRFRCRHCARRFTARTFSPTYWLHHRTLLLHVADLSVDCACARQIGRDLHIAHSTVLRHLARAGRHCLLFHRRLIEGRPPAEPLVFDGFESFEFSQFHPLHLNLAVGAHSWFVYGFTDSPLRRKGRMTPQQKVRREQLERTYGRPDPKAVENGIVELLKPLLRGVPGVPWKTPPPAVVELRSDEHKAYPRALARLSRMSGVPRIVHETTSSKAPRTPLNPLFAVNLADLLLRHSGADHKRETIAFNKRRQAMLERLAVFTVWRNLVKWRQEKRPGDTTASYAGFTDRRWQWNEVFAQRQFPHRRQLPGPWWKYYWRRVKTPMLGHVERPALPKYAF